jgi:hypothetical protein
MKDYQFTWTEITLKQANERTHIHVHEHTLQYTRTKEMQGENLRQKWLGTDF